MTKKFKNAAAHKAGKENTLVLFLTGILLGAGINCLLRRKTCIHDEERMWFI